MRHRLAIPLLLLVVACGGAQREKAVTTTRAGLSTALAATNAARDAFTTWSRAQEMAIVERATSREAGAAELAAHRARSQRVIGALVVAYTSIAAADASLTLAAVKPAELPLSIQLATKALEALMEARDAVLVLKGGG